MKKKWTIVVAMLATLCGAERAIHAQSPGGGAQPELPQGAYYQVSPSGQTYLMVPNGEPGAAPAAAATSASPASVPSGLGDLRLATYNGGGAPSCDAGTCGSPNGGCKPGCCCDKCCGIDGWDHCWSVYGGLMYLRARDSEVTWATTANGPIVPGGSPIQVAPLAVLDQDFQPGFFVGLTRTLDSCSSIGVQYSQFESSTYNSIATTPPQVIVPLIDHPSTVAGASTYLFGEAGYSINFKTLDIDYRQLIYGECGRKLNFLLGARLAQYEQRLDAEFSVLGTENLSTDIDFYGAGIRGGLEYERIGSRGVMIYGKAIASFVPGEFRADYLQQASFDPVVVNTGWTAGRLVTMVDLEVGIGWVNCCDTFRVSAGYLISTWYNTVQTDEWINGVQNNNFIDMSSMTSFDGLMARAEFRF